jgi:hypothetical protein
MFKVGDLLHNKTSNEDGRVVAISFEDDIAFYEVSASGDRTSALLGSRVSHWAESDVEASGQQVEQKKPPSMTDVSAIILCACCGKPCNLEDCKVIYDGKPAHSDCLAPKLIRDERPPRG